MLDKKLDMCSKRGGMIKSDAFECEFKILDESTIKFK